MQICLQLHQCFRDGTSVDAGYCQWFVMCWIVKFLNIRQELMDPKNTEYLFAGDFNSGQCESRVFLETILVHIENARISRPGTPTSKCLWNTGFIYGVVMDIMSVLAMSMDVTGSISTQSWIFGYNENTKHARTELSRKGGFATNRMYAAVESEPLWKVT